MGCWILVSREPGDIVRPRIKLEDCLDSFASPCEVADFYSSAIKARTTAFKFEFCLCCRFSYSCRTTKLKTFPDYLVLHMARFVIGDNWAVKKLGITSFFFIFWVVERIYSWWYCLHSIRRFCGSARWNWLEFSSRQRKAVWRDWTWR